MVIICRKRFYKSLMNQPCLHAETISWWSKPFQLSFWHENSKTQSKSKRVILIQKEFFIIILYFWITNRLSHFRIQFCKSLFSIVFVLEELLKLAQILSVTFMSVTFMSVTFMSVTFMSVTFMSVTFFSITFCLCRFLLDFDSLTVDSWCLWKV